MNEIMSENAVNVAKALRDCKFNTCDDCSSFGFCKSIVGKGIKRVAADLLDAQVAELERYRQWVNDLQSGMYINCVYCGHRYGPRENTPVSMADVLKEHIEHCPEHPMSKLKAKNAELEVKLAMAEDGLTELRQKLGAAVREIPHICATCKHWHLGPIDNYCDIGFVLCDNTHMGNWEWHGQDENAEGEKYE